MKTIKRKPNQKPKTNKPLVLDMLVSYGGLTAQQICDKTALGEETVFKHLRSLIGEKKAIKTPGKINRQYIYVSTGCTETEWIPTHPMMREVYKQGRYFHRLKLNPSETIDDTIDNSLSQPERDRLIRAYIVHKDIDEIFHYTHELLYFLPKNSHQAEHLYGAWINLSPNERISFMSQYMEIAKTKNRSLLPREIRDTEYKFLSQLPRRKNNATTL